LVVDNLFGGSGMFLSHLPAIMKAGKPVDWVSSSKDADIVASVRRFAGLAKGATGAATAEAFRKTRHKNTPRVTNWTCKSDKVQTIGLEKCLEQLRQTRILVVGGGWGGDEFRKASKEITGVELVPIAFEELAGAHAQADGQAAKAFAEQWTHQAERIEGVSPQEMENCGAMYVAMKQLMAKHGARGISINCLGGFYGGHLKAYPCLGFSQFNNDLLVGGCEADQMSALTMTIMSAWTGRPGFISDPVIDTSRNAIIYAHCVATTKPFGPEGKANPYQILTHSEDRKGASIRSLLPAGYMTTTLEINPTTRQVLMHQAKALGNNPSDMACRTKLEAAVKGDIEKLTEHWSMGWHRVTFYGDLKPQVQELAQRLKLQLVEEA
jgi:L-fucose isomerase-like protein